MTMLSSENFWVNIIAENLLFLWQRIVWHLTLSKGQQQKKFFTTFQIQKFVKFIFNIPSHIFANSFKKNHSVASTFNKKYSIFLKIPWGWRFLQSCRLYQKWKRKIFLDFKQLGCKSPLDGVQRELFKIYWMESTYTSTITFLEKITLCYLSSNTQFFNRDIFFNNETRK